MDNKIQFTDSAKNEINRILGRVDEMAVSDENLNIPFVIGETVKKIINILEKILSWKWQKENGRKNTRKYLYSKIEIVNIE